MYGKDNRILCSAEFSQGFKVVAARRTRQGAGVSIGGSKIRVTGPGNPWRRRIVPAEGAVKSKSLPQSLTLCRDRHRVLQPAGTRSLNEPLPRTTKAFTPEKH